MSIEWKRPFGFPLYEVTRAGDIRKTTTLAVLSPSVDEDGRRTIVILDSTGQRRNKSIASLVLLAWGLAAFGPGEIGQADQARLHPQTEKSQKALEKLTDAEAAKLADRIEDGKTSLRALSGKLGVSRSAIKNAILRVRPGFNPKPRRPTAA